MASEKVEYAVIGKDVGGSKVFKDVGDAADKAGDKVEDFGEKAKEAGDHTEGLGEKTRKAGEDAEDTGEQYRGLAADIEHAQSEMRRLADEIDKTGNKDLFKDLRKQRSELRKLMSAKDLLPNDDETRKEAVRFGGRMADGVASGLSTAGGPIARALGNVFGVLPPQAQLAIGAGVIAAVGATAPLLGGIVAGAIVGGAGVGGVIGGVAVAARHPEVKAAASLTGKTFAETMERAAVSFVPATVDALGTVRAEITDMGDDFERIFSKASRFVEPLTDGLMGMVREFLPGFEDAIEHAGPAIDAIASGLQEIGSATGDLFSTMADNAHEGGNALGVLFLIMEAGIRTVDLLVGGLSKLYGGMVQLGMILNHDIGGLMEWRIQQEQAKQEGEGFSQNLQDLISGFGKVDTTVGAATAKLETFAAMIKRVTGENISAERANINLEEAIDRATEAAKRNGDGIDANNPKQRANREALIGIADAANDAYAAILTQTGSQELAAAAAERGRRKFLETADAMGVEKAEAKRLADMLFGIPGDVSTKADLDKAAAERKIKGLLDWLDRIPSSKTITVNVRAGQRSGVGGLGGLPFSDGGRVDGPGTDTSDDIVSRLSRGEYVVRARAARAVGYDFLDAINQADRRPGALASGRTPSVGSARPMGGDAVLAQQIGREVARQINGATLRIDDRSGTHATLIAIGGG